MSRPRQLVFVVAMLSLCWLWMMIVHELGHVAGAMLTGGRVQQVVLRPAAISRTDVAPNPRPGIVVWLGPLIGSLLPLAGWLLIARRGSPIAVLAGFFAGFCLIANGAYISLGVFDRVGDCGEMLKTGTPVWVMELFGMTAISAGLSVWHWLGTIGGFWKHPEVVSWRLMLGIAGAALLVVFAELLLSGE